MGSGEVASGPGVLEIEAASHSIDVEDLAGKIKARADFAL